MTSRRSFLLGIGAALAAPAIVRAESLMNLWVPPAPALIPYRPPSLELQAMVDAYVKARLEWVAYHRLSLVEVLRTPA